MITIGGWIGLIIGLGFGGFIGVIAGGMIVDKYWKRHVQKDICSMIEYAKRHNEYYEMEPAKNEKTYNQGGQTR